MMFKAAAILVSAGFAAAAYPSEFPFENESVVPAAPLEATPSWTFDEADSGGYIYSFSYAFDMTDAMCADGFCFGNNGFFAHQTVVRAGDAPLLDSSWFNCTKNGHKLGAYSYYGELAGIKICDEGECCKDFWGTWTYYDASGPYDAYYEDLGKVYNDGGCTEMAGEQVYCSFMAASQNIGCFEQYATASERMVVYACYDSVYNHYMGCTLYKISGHMFRPSQEPVAYLEASSAEQVNAANALYWMPDRVCHPYSYYFPEFAKSESASSSDAESESESESDESGTAWFGVVFATVSALLW